MTKNRSRVYNRSWYKRDCKIDMKKRRKEYNRKVRHLKITSEDDSCSRGLWKNARKLEWNTIA